MAHSNLDLYNAVTQSYAEKHVLQTEGPSTAVLLGRRLRGLSWNKTHHLWRVRIYYAGKLRFVGRFKDAINAARAYDKAAVYLYGANAITNFGIEACLSDTTTDVGPCIVHAKLEADQAAHTVPYTGSSLMAAAAPHCFVSSAGHTGRRNVARSTSIGSSGGRSTSLQLGNSPGVQGNRVSKQRQMELLANRNADCISTQPDVPCSTAAAAAAAGIILEPFRKLPPVENRPISHYHHQQQRDVSATSTRSIALPSTQCFHEAAAITAATMLPAAASTSSTTAARSADQASLVQLLLHAHHHHQQQRQQQQEVVISNPVCGFSSCQQVQNFLPLLPQLLPASAAATLASTVHCHQPSAMQPLLFSPHVTKNSPSAVEANTVQAAVTAAAVSAASGVLEQTLDWGQQQQLFGMSPQEYRASLAQSLALEQHLHALSLGANNVMYPASINTVSMHLAAAAAENAGSINPTAVAGSRHPVGSDGSILVSSAGSIASISSAW